MTLKTKVKAGRITNLSDARYCAGMGVDMLGFAIDGPEAISLEKFKEINGWVTGPEIVLEIGTAENADERIAQFSGHCIEVEASLLPSLKNNTNLALIVRVDLDEWKTITPLLTSHKDHVRFLIVKDYLDASIKTIKEAAKEYPLLVELTDPEVDIDELLELPIAGIALTGTDEDKPGLKDYQQLSGILEKLEVN